MEYQLTTDVLWQRIAPAQLKYFFLFLPILHNAYFLPLKSRILEVRRKYCGPSFHAIVLQTIFQQVIRRIIQNFSLRPCCDLSNCFEVSPGGKSPRRRLSASDDSFPPVISPTKTPHPCPTWIGAEPSRCRIFAEGYISRERIEIHQRHPLS